jgi:iron-sulfur cluster repair protein YtfE (RIC family)
MDEQLERMLAAFERGDRAQALEVWTAFEAQLRNHLTLEERVLMPLVLKRNYRTAMALLQEHKHLRQRMDELSVAVELHVARAEQARAFAMELQAHARHEDRVLYAVADEIEQDADASRIIAEFVSSLKPSP